MLNYNFSLNIKTAELVAIGASIGSNCLPCLRYHFAEAIKNGCSIQEIEETVKISKMVKEKPANDINKFAEDLLRKELSKKEKKIKL